jgi:hypothetical protein
MISQTCWGFSAGVGEIPGFIEIKFCPKIESVLSDKAVRINISLPERVLRNVDHFANSIGETRSGLLAEAVSQYIKTKRRPRKTRK